MYILFKKNREVKPYELIRSLIYKLSCDNVAHSDFYADFYNDITYQELTLILQEKIINSFGKSPYTLYSDEQIKNGRYNKCETVEIIETNNDGDLLIFYSCYIELRFPIDDGKNQVEQAFKATTLEPNNLTFIVNHFENKFDLIYDSMHDSFDDFPLNTEVNASFGPTL